MKALLQLDSKTRIVIESDPFWVKFWKGKYRGSKVLAWVEKKKHLKSNNQMYTKYTVRIGGLSESVEIIAVSESSALTKAYEKHKKSQPDIKQYTVTGPIITLN